MFSTEIFEPFLIHECHSSALGNCRGDLEWGHPYPTRCSWALHCSAALNIKNEIIPSLACLLHGPFCWAVVVSVPVLTADLWRGALELIQGTHFWYYLASAAPFRKKKSIMLFPYSRPYENILFMTCVWIQYSFVIFVVQTQARTKRKRPRKLQNAFSLTQYLRSQDVFISPAGEFYPLTFFMLTLASPDWERWKEKEWHPDIDHECFSLVNDIQMMEIPRVS